MESKKRTLLQQLTAARLELLQAVCALPAASLFETRVSRPGGRPISPRTLLAAEARNERPHAAQVRANIPGSTYQEIINIPG